MAPVFLCGAFLFGRGLYDQGLRLVLLLLRQGLGFADPACTTGYCDFSMFWLAGFLVSHGQSGVLYDHAAYVAAAANILPYRSGYWPFVYPPTVLPAAWLFSLISLPAGYYLFSADSLAASVWLLRLAGRPAWGIALGLISPAAMWNLYLGQWGLLCGALLLAGLAMLKHRPMLAGVLLGCLAVKPQYALLVPVIVLAGRAWRAVPAGLLTVCTLACLSLLAGGGATWAGWFGPGRAALHALLTAPFGAYQVMGISVLWMLRSLHAPLALAWAGQGLVSCCAGLAGWRLWRGKTTDPRRLACTVFLALLASPYGFTDDLAIYSVLLPGLARAHAPWRNATLAGLWLAPVFILKFVALTGMLPTPLLLVLAILLERVSEEESYFL